MVLKRMLAVIDTNVILSALITRNEEAATVKVLDAVFDGIVIPLYHEDIIQEYDEVLHRDRFRLSEEKISLVLNQIVDSGIKVEPTPTGKILIDMDDLIFYEVVMEKRDKDAYLVTGNIKHYPIEDFIITPTEAAELLGL